MNTVNYKTYPLRELIDVIGNKVYLQFISVLRLLLFTHMLDDGQANGKGVPYLFFPFTFYVIALHILLEDASHSKIRNVPMCHSRFNTCKHI